MKRPSPAKGLAAGMALALAEDATSRRQRGVCLNIQGIAYIAPGRSGHCSWVSREYDNLWILWAYRTQCFTHAQWSMLSFPGWWFQIRQGVGVAFLAIKAGWKQQPGKWPFVSFALFGFKNIDEVEPPSAWQFDWGKPPVFSPACETTTASPSPSTVPTVPSPAAAVPNRATVPPSVNVTAALYPLDSRYVASSKACPAACLGKPGKDCEKRYCCKAKGSADTFETLSYEHVAFLRIRCQGNINHDFHQSFWPFFWWTAVYNNSDFAILVDRMAKHPNTSCPAAY